MCRVIVMGACPHDDHAQSSSWGIFNQHIWGDYDQHSQTRTPTPITAIPNTVRVIDRASLDTQLGTDLDGTPRGLGHDGIAVAVKADQAGAGHGMGCLVEAVERRQHRLQRWPFEIQRLGNGQLLLLGMRVQCRPAPTLGLQPSVELLDTGKAQAGLEETTPDGLDLMLNLTLLPSCRRRAGRWFDHAMIGHDEEAAVEHALLADEHCCHCGLHVMGWTPPVFRPTCRSTRRRKAMTMEILAIDLGKQSFHLHGIDADGVVISRKVSRAKLENAVTELDPAIVAMEACASAHHWGRRFSASGRQVRLVNPRFVKAFVRGSKNDAIDAEAIFDAASRPTMRFVPVKTTEQQDLQSLHRVRERLVVQRTSLINHARGLLAEYGVVLPKGPWRFRQQVPAAVAEADLSNLARELFTELMDQLTDVEARLAKLDAKLVSICREHEACRRLAALPGVGPVIATALVAAVDDGRHFRSGRELAAWIGLVPRQYTTGGKPRLGGIGRRANHYLRRQLIHGARAVISRLAAKDDGRSVWLKGIVARAGFNKALVALANKTARLAWVLLARKEDYLPA